MKRITILLTAALAAAASASSCSGDMTNTADSSHTLWYDEPAEIWEETLPLGNGRLGMMPDGGISQEWIVLNEISMWSGSEADYSNPDAAESLPAIRALLCDGRNADAQKLMYERFVPHKPTDGGTYGSYQNLGFLIIKNEGMDCQTSDYTRGLDLRTATAWTKFTAGGNGISRKYYVPKGADVMVVEMESEQEGGLNFEASFIRKERYAVEVVRDGLMKMSGTLDSGADRPGIGYAAYAHVVADGKNAKVNGSKVSDADRAWIIISAATSWSEGSGYDSKALSILEDVSKGFCGRKAEKLHRQSVREHQELYCRAEIDIENEGDEGSMTTDRRIAGFAEGGKDNSLAALYYHYGRYLLICSTRPGSLPPNLQGLWANTCSTPWNGDYHTNINVQMNHWIAEQGNLSELHLPLTDLVMRMIPSGERTAKAFYGPEAEGWVQHMMTNVWNYTEPGEHPSWGATNTGGAWLCAHLWEHYEFTLDKEYLSRVYPALEGAARFFLSTMIKEPKYGYLVTGPTSSPENEFWSDGKRTSICLGPTMDNQLVRELFSNTIAASEVLNTDKPFADSLRYAVTQLAPHKISDGGYLMEWLEDYEEVDIHHRHVSHLYGLHPSNQISPVRTPELAEACKATLNRRGDEATGWSRAWKMNFWARLGDGERALKLFRSLLVPACSEEYGGHHVSGTYPNLFCSHPPFQIDGNFGGAAGIGEMLIQSHDGFVNILPALPAEWKTGSLRRFKVRGGAEIDLEWVDGKAVSISVHQPEDAEITIRANGGYRKLAGSCTIDLTK